MQTNETPISERPTNEEDKGDLESNFIYAVEQEDHVTVSDLLKNGVDVNIRTCEIYHKTPLIIAAANRNVEIMNALLENGANPNLADVDGVTPLMIAAMNGYTEIITALIKSKPDVNKQTTEGIVISEYTVRENHRHEIITANPIGKGTDQYIGPNFSALMLAVLNGHVEIARLLLIEEAYPDLIDSYGNTASMFAAKNGHQEIIDILIINNADINAQNEDGDTALMHAVYNGHVEIARTLLRNGADVDEKNADGDTALMLAVDTRHVECVKDLVKKTSDVNVQNNFGITALMGAVIYRHEEIMVTLIKAGADAKLGTPSGITALMIAAMYKYPEHLAVFGTDIKENNEALIEAKQKVPESHWRRQYLSRWLGLFLGGEEQNPADSAHEIESKGLKK